MLYKDNAIIIRLRNFAEADKIAVLLTQKHGRIEAIAKSVRSSKSKRSAQIELANYGLFSLAEGKSFDIITQIRIESSFDHARLSLEKAALLYYILELTDRFTIMTEQDSNVFVVLKEVLNYLQNDIAHDHTKARHYFETKLLYVTGFLDRDFEKYKGSQQLERIYKILKFTEKSGFSDFLKLQLTSEDVQILDKLLYTQVTNVLEKEVKSYKFLKQVLQGNGK